MGRDRSKPNSALNDFAIYSEQVILFEFGFGSDGTKTLWPHIQVNTLVRKSTPLADESEANGKRSRRSA